MSVNQATAGVGTVCLGGTFGHQLDFSVASIMLKEAVQWQSDCPFSLIITFLFFTRGTGGQAVAISSLIASENSTLHVH